MTSDEDRQKKRKRLKRNHLAKALEDRLFRQRKISKDYKLKKIKEVEESFNDLHSD